jgi:hypothetical protein
MEELKLNQNRLKQMLKYDAETGQFTWLVKSGPLSAGAIAGTPHNGYLRIQVDGKCYRAHRLAFFYVNGSMPIDEIDHINGIKNDNRWVNLRTTNHQTNMQNQSRAHSSNGCKTLGVSMQGAKYRARVRVNGKNKNLGMFNSPDAAHLAYVFAKREFHAGCVL